MINSKESRTVDFILEHWLAERKKRLAKGIYYCTPGGRGKHSSSNSYKENFKLRWKGQ